MNYCFAAETSTGKEAVLYMETDDPKEMLKQFNTFAEGIEYEEPFILTITPENY